MKTKFEQPGTFPPTGPLGRTIRFLLGVLILYLVFPPMVKHYEAITRLREGWETPIGNLFLAILFAVYLLPHTLDRGFTLKWGHRSQLVLLLLALAAAAFDFAYYGSLWGPPLGWLVLLTIVYVFGHLGLSFIVAAIAATPG